MPYRVGAKGSYGCSGYPALKVGTNEVMGCHETRTQAAAQIYAINQSEGNIGKNMHTLKEGDFVMGTTTEGLVHGMIEHIMTEGGTLGTPGSEYALVSMPPENPAMSVRIYEEEDGEWEPTAYSIGMMYADAQKIDIEEHQMDAEETMKSYHSENEDEDKWDNMTKACWVGYEQRGMKEKDGRMVPNCVPAKKATLANAPYQDANSEREMKEEDKEIEMAVLCPSFVFGPPPPMPSNMKKDDATTSSSSYSLTLIKQWLQGKSQVQSRLCADVRDVARAHVRAGTMHTLPENDLDRRYILSREERLSSEATAQALIKGVEMAQRKAGGNINIDIAKITCDNEFTGGAIKIGDREVEAQERLERDLGVVCRPVVDTMEDMAEALLFGESL